MSSKNDATERDSITFRRLLPHIKSTDVDLAEAYAYPSGYEHPWVRANMVSSADGGAVGTTGRTRELSSDVDRRVMGTLRGLCDVVLVGAATARMEGYRPLRPRAAWRELREGRPGAPRIAVVSRSLDLPKSLLTEEPEAPRPLVITVPGAPAERRKHVAEHVELVVVDGDSVSPRCVIDTLAERGLYRVLTEGGPHLLAEFVAAELLDELCLTTSPLFLGSGAPRIVAGGPGTPGAPEDLPRQNTPLRIAHLLESDGNLFARYVRD